MAVVSILMEDIGSSPKPPSSGDSTRTIKDDQRILNGDKRHEMKECDEQQGRAAEAAEPRVSSVTSSPAPSSSDSSDSSSDTVEKKTASGAKQRLQIGVGARGRALRQRLTEDGRHDDVGSPKRGNASPTQSASSPSRVRRLPVPLRESRRHARTAESTVVNSSSRVGRLPVPLRESRRSRNAAEASRLNSITPSSSSRLPKECRTRRNVSDANGPTSARSARLPVSLRQRIHSPRNASVEDGMRVNNVTPSSSSRAAGRSASAREKRGQNAAMARRHVAEAASGKRKRGVEQSSGAKKKKDDADAWSHGTTVTPKRSTYVSRRASASEVEGSQHSAPSGGPPERNRSPAPGFLTSHSSDPCSDECSDDLESTSSTSSSGLSSVSVSSVQSSDGDDKPVVKKALDRFTTESAYICTQSDGDSLPLLVMSEAFLKPSAQGGNLDSPKWLQTVYSHLFEGGEESMIDRCKCMRLKKEFAQYKPSEMRHHMTQIAATRVHSWTYLDGLQKVHLSLKEGLYRSQLNEAGGIDLCSRPVLESCKRKLAFAAGENIMNSWTLPCAFGRAFAFEEVVTTLLKRAQGSAAMFARPACHHVPMWRSRCPLCKVAGDDADVLCGFAHCDLMFHKSCLDEWMGKHPKASMRRKNRKGMWVCPFHGKKIPAPCPIDEVACGFSYINATAYALRIAQQSHPNHLVRMAIVDIDVHHGNGNQSVFYDDPSVLVISMHRGALVCERTGLPEFIGTEKGKGFNINLPLEIGDDDQVALVFLHMIIIPVIKIFAPDLLVVALGFDALDMGTDSGVVPGMDCRFSRDVYGDIVGNLKNVVPRICLHSEGGYDPEQVGQAAVGCVKALLGEWTLTTEKQVMDSLANKRLMARVCRLQYRLVKLGWEIGKNIV